MLLQYTLANMLLIYQILLVSIVGSNTANYLDQLWVLSDLISLHNQRFIAVTVISVKSSFSSFSSSFLLAGRWLRRYLV